MLLHNSFFKKCIQSVLIIYLLTMVLSVAPMPVLALSFGSHEPTHNSENVETTVDLTTEYYGIENPAREIWFETTLSGVTNDLGKVKLLHFSGHIV